MHTEENVVDDQGTTQAEAQETLAALLSNGFDSEIDLMAQALGRPAEEIADAINGDEVIDEDLLMKARGLAQQRNINLDTF